MTPVVGAIGTTHPYGSAGLLLDLTVVRALGARPVAIVAGVSAQDAGRVLARTPLDEPTIAAQFEALAGIEIAAFCVGALLDAAGVRAVAAGLGRRARVPVVCDPVIAASGGGRLASDDALAALRTDFLRHVTLLTPNLDEAAVLTGRPIASVAAMHAAVPALLALGPAAVLIKGGHLAGDAVDVFGDARRTLELRAPRIAHELRGTGSLLAAAVATRCAFGDTPFDAIVAARAFVRERIANGTEFAEMRVAY